MFLPDDSPTRTAALEHNLEFFFFFFVTTGLKAVRVGPAIRPAFNYHPDIMGFNSEFPLNLMCMEFLGSQSMKTSHEHPACLSIVNVMLQR